MAKKQYKQRDTIKDSDVFEYLKNDGIAGTDKYTPRITSVADMKAVIAAGVVPEYSSGELVSSTLVNPLQLLDLHNNPVQLIPAPTVQGEYITIKRVIYTSIPCPGGECVSYGSTGEASNLVGIAYTNWAPTFTDWDNNIIDNGSGDINYHQIEYKGQSGSDIDVVGGFAVELRVTGAAGQLTGSAGAGTSLLVNVVYEIYNHLDLYAKAFQ